MRSRFLQQRVLSWSLTSSGPYRYSCTAASENQRLSCDFVCCIATIDVQWSYLGWQRSQLFASTTTDDNGRALASRCWKENFPEYLTKHANESNRYEHSGLFIKRSILPSSCSRVNDREATAFNSLVSSEEIWGSNRRGTRAFSRATSGRPRPSGLFLHTRVTASRRDLEGGDEEEEKHLDGMLPMIIRSFVSHVSHIAIVFNEHTSSSPFVLRSGRS